MVLCLQVYYWSGEYGDQICSQENVGFVEKYFMCPPNSQPALTVTGKTVEIKDVAKSWQENGKNIGLYRRERKGSDPNKNRITVADVAVAAVIVIRTIFTAPNAIIMSARVPSTAGKTTIRPILVPSAKGSLKNEAGLSA